MHLSSVTIVVTSEKLYKNEQINTACTSIKQFIENDNCLCDLTEKKEAQSKLKTTLGGLGVEVQMALFEKLRKVSLLNQHENSKFDKFWGIRHTKTWIETWKTLREEAKETLLQEVKIESIEEKSLEAKLKVLTARYKRLTMAISQPLFCEFRKNRWWYDGTFFNRRTTTVKEINGKTLQELREKAKDSLFEDVDKEIEKENDDSEQKLKVVVRQYKRLKQAKSQKLFNEFRENRWYDGTIFNPHTATVNRINEKMDDLYLQANTLLEKRLEALIGPSRQQLIAWIGKQDICQHDPRGFGFYALEDARKCNLK